MKIELNPSATIPAHYANRHTLITGPTGTGKTVTIMRMIESLALIGTPVIAPDVKGDLPPLASSCRAQIMRPGVNLFAPLYLMGADLIARSLELTEAQAGALEIAFAWADEIKAPLDTLDDLGQLLADIVSNPERVAHIGYTTRASVGTIQRACLRLEKSGVSAIFGAPAFDIGDVMGDGLVSIIDASRLYNSPRIYGAFMLWLLREIATRFPETGDLDRPRLALVIDEAHCLFHEASPSLLRSVEATARLIRSKGVALVFASQSPEDLPRVVREQCSTTIEHARAYGVGHARFCTLTPGGAMTTPAMIRPSLPDAMQSPSPERVAALELIAPPPPRRLAMIQPADSDVGQVSDALAFAALGLMCMACISLGYLIATW